jgi:curved DNA-binding protein CbpA
MLMPEKNYEKYFEILELRPEASLDEIKNSYMRLKKLYASDSMVLAPLAEEFPERKRKKILNQIEVAYSRLLALHQNTHSITLPAAKIHSPTPQGIPEESGEIQSEHPDFNGHAIREIREKLGIELSEISQQLKLRVELLRSIENENFEALPEETYLKTHLKNYALCLNLNPNQVVEGYIRYYREWKDKA